MAFDENVATANDPIRWLDWPHESLAECGAHLASEGVVHLPLPEPFDFRRRLAENQAAIRHNYFDTAEASQDASEVTPAARWLLDNHHVAEENFRHVERDLSAGHYQRLPKLEASSGQKVPRTLVLAWHYVAATNSEASAATLSEMVEGHQRLKPLTISELWAVPALLRFVLLENLRRISTNVESARKKRRAANALADRVSRAKAPQDAVRLLDALAPRDMDDVYAAQLIYRFRHEGGTSSATMAWLEEALRRRGTSADIVLEREHMRQSSSNVTTGNIISSLKWLNDLNWMDWVESVGRVDRILQKNSEYGQLDRASRNAYRETVERIAGRSSLSEIEVAELALELADHRAAHLPGPSDGVGYYLVGAGRADLEGQCNCKPRLGEQLLRQYRKLDWFGIFAPMFILAALFCAGAAFVLTAAGIPVPVQLLLVALVWIPAAEAAQGLIGFLFSRLIKPVLLPGFDFSKGIPEDARTFVVVPCLISSRDIIDELTESLESHYLSNNSGEVYFGLLSDWADSDEERSAADDALLTYAQEKIEALCERYEAAGPRRFFLLHRRRLYNPSEARWMGWERKRGKLTELNDLLRGESDTTFIQPVNLPPGPVEFVLTLDADTRLPRDTVSHLAGKLAHPLNRPVWHEEDNRVIRGYGLLQPRVTPSLTTGDETSIFQRAYSSGRGMDPYVFAASDLYQDLLHEGSFTGKGMYHVDTFRAAVANRIPENAVLSHDLIEGSWLRTALCSDVQVVEDFPVRYDVEVSRQHRWMRGDWQLLPFLFNLSNGLSQGARLKMLDNLRRSLVPVAWVISCLAGWLLLDFLPMVVWQALLLLLLVVSSFLKFDADVLPSRSGVSLPSHIRALLIDAAELYALMFFRLTFRLHGAIVSLDAIARTLYRVLVSHRRLLEWRTAREAAGSGDNDLGRIARSMLPVQIAAVGMLIAVVLINPETTIVAAPFLALWFFSPFVAYAASQPLSSQDRLEIDARTRAELRTIARTTWRYFEETVVAERHYLPPDNFQETPEPKFAERTSPTNIGLYLLSVISARDMGWIGFSEALSRVDKTVGTLEALKKHKGHLYNWYDVQTLDVLEPRYISTVDSGNLAGHLIAVAASLRLWAESPAVSMLGHLKGIEDTLNVLEASFSRISNDRKVLRPIMRRLEERIAGFRVACRQYGQEPQVASVRSINLSLMADGIMRLARDLAEERGDAESAELAHWSRSLKSCCQAAFDDSVVEADRKSAARETLLSLSERTRALAFQMDFTCLYDASRRLFSVGYLVPENRLDASRYDLLASECRLASFFAVAKGDVPNEHWFRLGRGMIAVGWSGALVSWSGSMFEYLMAPLIMDEPSSGILNRSSYIAVSEQRRRFSGSKIPWGISECAIAVRDHDMNYQYRAQGLPALALKRDYHDELVIAPYATALAAQIRPREAVANFHVLKKLGAYGKYGFYDALDYTRERLSKSADFALVRNYMAHHQGMTIAAITNAVLNGIHRERFHQDPVVKASELLLQEKSPREIYPLTQLPQRTTVHEDETADEDEHPDTIIDPSREPNGLCLLSNRRYALMLTAKGAGRSMFGDLAVTRWGKDPLREDFGTHIFVRKAPGGTTWSATPSPVAPGEGAQPVAIFSDHKAEYRRSADGLESRLECIVASEGAGEARRITLRNTTDEACVVDITSYGEIVLALQAADSAHPAFSKMFVQTQIDAERGIIFAHRRPRTEQEKELHLAHFIVLEHQHDIPAAGETDRRSFLGRGNTLRTAQALLPDAELSGRDGFTLDPIFSLRRQLRVPPNESRDLVFWTVVGETRAEVASLVEHYRHAATFDQEARMAWTRSRIQHHHMSVSPRQTEAFRQIAASLMYPATQADSDIADEAGDYRIDDLWAAGISGDFPILVLHIDAEADINVVKSAMKMQEYFGSNAFDADLVILNERSTGYVQDLQNAIQSLCEDAALLDPSHGAVRHVFALREDQLSSRTKNALQKAARLSLHARNGSLLEQAGRLSRQGEPVLQAPSSSDARQTARTPLPPESGAGPAPETGSQLVSWNGLGGFDPAGREYVMRFGQGTKPPHPWVNVIAKQGFGFLVAEDGASCTWGPNSRDYRVTPWSNDPVSNRSGEAFYVVDEDRHIQLSPFSAFCRDANARFEVRHGLGYSVFVSEGDGYRLEALVRLNEKTSGKQVQLRVCNTSGMRKSFRVFGYVELVLGDNRDTTAPLVTMDRNPDTAGAAPQSISARNRFNGQFADCRVSFSMTGEPDWWSTSRPGFVGSGADVNHPAALAARSLPPSGQTGTNDPCAILARRLELADGDEGELTFCLDVEQDAEPRKVPEGAVAKDSASGAIRWEDFVGALQVETPDQQFDLLVNTWLPYQTLSCRILGRSAFYQSSGAFGFRDQLQDSLALLLHDSGYARQQILTAAGRQFAEGDVQHWWSPDTGAGVRTMIADDVVWLAHGVSEYVQSTGEMEVLDEEVEFLAGEDLPEGIHDIYFRPEPSGAFAPLYEHCARALDLAIKRTGPNGLPLFLGGDWNDGMNRVGEEGRGESVWLGWFLARTLAEFMPYAETRDDAERLRRWTDHRARLIDALNTRAWDGEWFLRGLFDDGTPLGSSRNDECMIDSIAQSWAVLSEAGDDHKAQQAMDNVLKHLVDEEAGILRLFTPPFSRSEPDPGYIKSYPPGVRENGGQYTHAATWAILALARMGRPDEAYRLFDMINPINHSRDIEEMQRYRVEPYVIAADVYGTDAMTGRGGWTWYTGSGGWMLRVAVEGILGLRLVGGELEVKPNLPERWDGYTARVRIDGRRQSVKVSREASGEWSVTVEDAGQT